MTTNQLVQCLMEHRKVDNLYPAPFCHGMIWQKGGTVLSGDDLAKKRFDH